MDAARNAALRANLRANGETSWSHAGSAIARPNARKAGTYSDAPIRKFVQKTDSTPRLWNSQKSAKRIVITSSVNSVTITPATVRARDHSRAAAGASGSGMSGSVAE